MCDLDFKPGGCGSRDVALAIIAEVGIILGTRPSVIVDTGHGLHAYWPISDGQIAGGDIAEARALLKRWGRLVEHIAAGHNVAVDNVFDLARVMRLPGSHNNKSTGNGEAPILVTAQLEPGGPLSMAEVDERLTEIGVLERDDDRAAAAAKEVSPPDGWTFADDYRPARRTCGYVTKMINAWRTDRPKPGGGRNPFVYDRYIRLFCAYRNGCITVDDYQRGRQILADLLTELVTTTEPRRPVKRFEIRDFNKYGIALVASKTDEQVHAELGGHDHPADVKIDEEAFWNAYDELADCRDYARSVRVGPWAMLGSALTIAAATIPPHVVLPACVGDYASVNLYINLVGESGAIKSQAVAAARAWLQAASPPEPVKPGSGQGVAKCFAYVKRTKSGPEQVGKRWTAVASIPEVDTLTAAGAMTGSSLWAELRSAWSDERVGHDYADATKSVVLQPRRYRLCMIVGVQPLRAGPLFEDADAGTPQRFVWFPVDDPQAPTLRGTPPVPLDLPRWPEADTQFNMDNYRAQQLATPVDRALLRVLTIPSEAEAVVDAVAREKLRGNPDVDPLDGHRLLCQLKVAAALMRLCDRTEITSKDWKLAGIVMAVSDRTRAQVKNKLDAERTRRNLHTAEASGARKIVETQMAARAEAEDIARVADVIVAALTKAGDRTLAGSAVRRAMGRDRDRHLMPKALEYLEVDGRIKVEQIERRGQAGVKITLVEQTK